MPALRPLLRGAVSIAALLAALPATTEACERKPQPPVMITVGSNGMPAVNRDPIRACEGDTIRWIFQGGAREFSVIFTNAAKSPFVWDHLTGATVTGTIRAGAAQDGGTDGFKYDVEVGGKRLDPKIIVDP